MISAFMSHCALRHCIGASVLAVVALGSAGCGPSGTDVVSDRKPQEPQYRYEGTGKNKTKTRIRPEDLRREELQEAAKREAAKKEG
jgi:hypothetical protein